MGPNLLKKKFSTCAEGYVFDTIAEKSKDGIVNCRLVKHFVGLRHLQHLNNNLQKPSL